MNIRLKTKDLSLKTGIVFGLWLLVFGLIHIQAAKSTSCVGETFRRSVFRLNFFTERWLYLLSEKLNLYGQTNP
jgi:hypothetical protein